MTAFTFSWRQPQPSLLVSWSRFLPESAGGTPVTPWTLNFSQAGNSAYVGVI